jgi:hypothetical protein
MVVIVLGEVLLGGAGLCTMVCGMISLFRLLSVWFALVLVSCGSKEATAPVAASEGPLKVQQLEVRREEDHLLVRATVHFTNSTEEPVILRSESVGLLAGPEIISAFVRPFNEYPKVEPGKTGIARLEYWAEARQLAQELRLKYAGQVLVIKTAGEFNIEQLPEGQMVFLSWPAWQTR